MIDCIVIGAGPCGIVATKELLEQGIKNVLCLEQSESIGGTFSNTYDNLKLTSSATFSMFSDFWIGNDKQNVFWTKEEAVAYWERYAAHFGVNKHLKFGTKVVTVTNVENSASEDKSWQVELESGEKHICKRIVLAIGNNQTPDYPMWKDSLTNVTFSHSKNYTNPEMFKGKRVLIIGGGESGSDVAYQISGIAKECFVSLRSSTGWVVPRKREGHAADNSSHRGIWTLPVEFGTELGKRVLKKERARKDPIFDAVAELNELVNSKYGIRGVYGTKTLSLPKAMVENGCKIITGIVDVKEGGKKIQTAKGEIISDIDHVVFCTGYKNNIPFLPEEIQKCDPRSLYKHMLRPETKDRIAWLGFARPAFGSQFPIMEMQARLFSLIAAGKHKLPKAVEMEKTSSLDKAHYLEVFQENGSRVRSLVDYHHYMDDIAKVIGCEPPLKKYFFTNFKLWIHMVYGPTQATQFRLQGPGKKVEIGHEILRKLPVSTFNFIVKQGIRGRIKYAFKNMSPFYKKKIFA